MTDPEMGGLKISVSMKQETNGFQCYSLKTKAINLNWRVNSVWVDSFMVGSTSG